MANVTIELNDKQHKAYSILTDYDNGITEVLYGGGARGGKTWLGCLWQIINRISLPNSVGFIGRREFARLIDTTMKTFFEVLDSLGLTGYGEYKSSSSGGRPANSYYFPNGSMIFFRYIDRESQDPNYDRFGSYSITDMFLDEAQEIDEKAISVLRGRFSLLKGEYPDGREWKTIPKALYSCNPKRNWIYNDFVKPDREGKLKPYRAFVKALPKDNPYLEQAYLDNLLRADKVTVQRLYYGNFEYDDDPRTLCDYDAICDLFSNEHIKPVGAKSCSADIAGKGHDRFVVTSWQGNVCRIAVDKVYSPGKEVEADLRTIMVRDGIPRSLTIVDADGIGSFLESYLNGIKEFHGGARAMDAERYDNLKSECAFILADLINRRAIRIAGCTEEQEERIKNELGVLKQANVDNDLNRKGIIKKEEMKQLLGHSPDYLDALIMAMWFRRSKNSAGPTVTTHVYKNE